MRTAMGRIAGPLSPPTMFDSFGRRAVTEAVEHRRRAERTGDPAHCRAHGL
jgi:hypothetical protein